MKVKSFYIPKDEREIESLLSNKSVDVKKIITWNVDNLIFFDAVLDEPFSVIL